MRMKKSDAIRKMETRRKVKQGERREPLFLVSHNILFSPFNVASREILLVSLLGLTSTPVSSRKGIIIARVERGMVACVQEDKAKSKPA